MRSAVLMTLLLVAQGCGDDAPIASLQPPLPPSPGPAPAPAPVPQPADGPRRLATGPLQAIAWAADDQDLYWLQHDGTDPLGEEEYPGSIWRVPLDGSAAPAAVVRGLSAPAGLGLAGESLYLARGAGSREAVRVRKSDGAIEPLFAVGSIPTLEGGHLWWKDDERTLHRRSVDGAGTDEVVLDVRARRNALIVAEAYSGETACALVIAGGRDATVECVSPGSAPRVIARERSQWVPNLIAIDGGHVYWVSVADHQNAMRAALTGPPAPQVIATSADPS